jgi:hypothetical protein
MPTTARLHVAERADLLTPDTARRSFERMLRIRVVETWLLRLYAERACRGRLRGTDISRKWPFPRKVAMPERDRAFPRPKPSPC